MYFTQTSRIPIYVHPELANPDDRIAELIDNRRVVGSLEELRAENIGYGQRLTKGTATITVERETKISISVSRNLLTFSEENVSRNGLSPTLNHFLHQQTEDTQSIEIQDVYLLFTPVKTDFNDFTVDMTTTALVIPGREEKY